MKSFLEIAGISLQIFAGLFLILGQIEKDFLDSAGKWIKDRMAILSGQPKRRRKILVFVTLVSLPTVMLLSLFSTSRNEITWSVIGGLLIWSIMGYDIYLYSLGYLGKRLISGARLLFWCIVGYEVFIYSLGRFGKKLMVVTERDGLAYLISEGKLIRYNLILFGISSAWVVGYYFITTHLVFHSGQSLVQVGLVSLYLMFTGFVFFPSALMSLTYLIGESGIGMISLSRGITRRQFWVAVLLVWLAGGASLIVSALLST